MHPPLTISTISSKPQNRRLPFFRQLIPTYYSLKTLSKNNFSKDKTFLWQFSLLTCINFSIKLKLKFRRKVIIHQPKSFHNLNLKHKSKPMITKIKIRLIEKCCHLKKPKIRLKAKSSKYWNHWNSKSIKLISVRWKTSLKNLSSITITICSKKSFFSTFPKPFITSVWYKFYWKAIKFYVLPFHLSVNQFWWKNIKSPIILKTKIFKSKLSLFCNILIALTTRVSKKVKNMKDCFHLR